MNEFYPWRWCSDVNNEVSDDVGHDVNDNDGDDVGHVIHDSKKFKLG